MGHIVITGPMVAGKTTLGRELATRLNRRFSDSDDQLEQTHRQSGREIAAEHGVEHLHRLERSHLREAVTDHERAVIAAAASVADDPSLLQQVVDRGHTLVFLDADVDGMESITAVGSHRRPLTAVAASSLNETRRLNVARAGGLVIGVSSADSVSDSLTAIAAALSSGSPSLFDS